MAKWSDILTLITETAPTDETDDYGFYEDASETTREVFANKKSVGYSEFYKSAQAGYATELKFDVHSQDYNGETLVEHGGKRYKVLRTYESKNGEFVELTLTDLSERETPEEGGGGDGEV
jgi:hypothetical protein